MALFQHMPDGTELGKPARTG